MHERQVAAFAGRMERGRGLGQVLADDAGVADLLVAVGELIVGEADGARVMGELRVLERTRVQRDRSRLLAAGKRDPAVQAPERGQRRVGDRLANRVGRSSEGGRGLREVVLQQPCFRQRGANGQFVVASERSGAQERRQQLRSFGAAPAFERRMRAGERRLNGCRRHRDSVSTGVYRGIQVSV